jgi:hypothetical protein
MVLTRELIHMSMYHATVTEKPYSRQSSQPWHPWSATMSSEANPLASFRSKVAAKHPSGRITMRSVARSSADAQITLFSTVLTDVCEHNHGS